MIPNWQTKFRNLPEIPKNKRWDEEGRKTIEQVIVAKLLNREQVSNEEEKIFSELTAFYSDLNLRLITLDYNTFETKDFEDFKNYIFYAFNYNALITNELKIPQTYRLVVNEDVTGQNKRITNTDFLKYPKLDIVKNINKFNRANTPNTHIFYSTENIDTALKEIRPPENKLITVGVWKPKTDKIFISFPISHSKTAIQENESVAKAKGEFEANSNSSNTLLSNYMRYYFQLFGREFTKKIEHHYEYQITALFSERILNKKEEPNPEFRYECIIYPSVGNGYITDNVAILPSVIDNDFYLDKIIEFEVEKEFYDKQYVLSDPENITLAKIKNGYVTNKIVNGRNIIW